SGACIEIEEVDIPIHRTISDFGKDREGSVSNCVATVIVKSTRCIPCVPVEEICSGPVACYRDG
ncbi:hypothetical protein A2U01_0079494, partial [Trifolium medium]|nr:hypothetical protein [Trifolium medium]